LPGALRDARSIGGGSYRRAHSGQGELDFDFGFSADESGASVSTYRGVELAALPAVASRDIVQNLTFIFTMLALAQLWNALSGWGGLISVGQQAFVGVGAYTFFGAVALAGLDPISAICCAALTAALVGAAVGPLLFRLEGPHFAVGTWVVAELLKLICSQIKSLGGGTGMSLPSSTYSHFLDSNKSKLFSASGRCSLAIFSSIGSRWLSSLPSPLPFIGL
jgi:ABC-type branched-subunit amino acid transport system permease subunit